MVEEPVAPKTEDAPVPVLGRKSVPKSTVSTVSEGHGAILSFEKEEEVEDPPIPEALRTPQPKKGGVLKQITASPTAEVLKPKGTPRLAPETDYTLEPLPEPPANRGKVPERKTKPLPKKPAGPWGSLISLSLGTLGFMMLAWIYLHDIPRESDEDLRPQVAVDQTPVTQAPVKMRAFLDSVVALHNPELRSQPAWTWDTPALAAFIQGNGPALDNLRDLLQDYGWHPHHSDWHREDLSAHPGWEHVGYLLQAHAAYLARRGDEESAFVAAIDLAEISRRLQEVWAWSGYMKRSMELQMSATQILAELLKSTRLDNAALQRFQEEFNQCHPTDDAMRQAYAAYYIHEKKLLLGPASGELLDTMPGGQMHQRPGRLFFKMNETLRLFASAFRELRDEISRPPYTRLSISNPTQRIRLTAPRFYHPNSSGERYFSDRIEPLLDLPQLHSLAQTRHELINCLFGIRRYLVTNHSLPGKLSDLTPDFLPTLPLDPFSGEPFHYESAKGLLYSVGVNLIAEGGKPSGIPLSDEREPTVQLGISMAVPVKK